MRSSILFIFLFPCSVVSAQPFSIAYGGDSTEILGAMIQTPDGGYLMTGGTASYVEFPPGTQFPYGSPYPRTGFIVKTDAVGAIDWSYTLGDTIRLINTGVAQRDDGGYFVVGFAQYYSTGTVQLMALINVTSNGSVIWSKMLGSYGNKLYPSRIIALGNDEYLIVGEFHIGVGAGEDSYQLTIKLNGNGDLIWSAAFGMDDPWNELADGRDVIMLGDGGFLIAGIRNFSGNVQLVKIDASGEYLWDRTYPDSVLFRHVQIRNTSDGIFLMGDHPMGTLLMKMDGFGESLWQKLYVHDLVMRKSVMDVRDDGELIFVATVSDPDIPAKAIIVHVNAEGDLISATQFGAASEIVRVVDLIAEIDGSITFSYDGISNWWGAEPSKFNMVRMQPGVTGFWSLCEHEPTTIQVLDIPELPFTSIMSQLPPFELVVTDRAWVPQVVGSADPQCINVAIAEAVTMSEAIVLYPNPANSGFVISYGSARRTVDVRITDKTGRQVYRTTAQLDEFIGVPFLAEGIYTCIIEDGKDLKAVKKLVIQ